MLILFDIDATLVTTHRAGVGAMGDAGRALYGETFDESRIEYAGRLDPLIIADLLVAHDKPVTADSVEAFRAAYGRGLERRLSEPGVSRPLPGVMELVGALRERDDLSIGLLTGNYPETGAVKLRAAGIEPEWFEVHVWGCDSPHDPPARDHLPLVGMQRHRAQKGIELDPNDVVIIGDTPHDVRCALVNGCRALGVATGSYDVAALQAAGAHRATPDLSDVEEALAWLMSAR
ncbi:MAG: HAD family hydrolase [Phycisphaeraceae bacterium]|nr:MAG: HAD family hydrolase [Phycisphaeraceae bacterium]